MFIITIYQQFAKLMATLANVHKRTVSSSLMSLFLQKVPLFLLVPILLFFVLRLFSIFYFWSPFYFSMFHILELFNCNAYFFNRMLHEKLYVFGFTQIYYLKSFVYGLVDLFAFSAKTLIPFVLFASFVFCFFGFVFFIYALFATIYRFLLHNTRSFILFLSYLFPAVSLSCLLFLYICSSTYILTSNFFSDTSFLFFFSLLYLMVDFSFKKSKYYVSLPLVFKLVIGGVSFGFSFFLFKPTVALSLALAMHDLIDPATGLVNDVIYQSQFLKLQVPLVAQQSEILRDSVVSVLTNKNLNIVRANVLTFKAGLITLLKNGRSAIEVNTYIVSNTPSLYTVKRVTVVSKPSWVHENLHLIIGIPLVILTAGVLLYWYFRRKEADSNVGAGGSVRGNNTSGSRQNSQSVSSSTNSSSRSASSSPLDPSFGPLEDKRPEPIAIYDIGGFITKVPLNPKTGKPLYDPLLCLTEEQFNTIRPATEDAPDWASLVTMRYVGMHSGTKPVIPPPEGVIIESISRSSSSSQSSVSAPLSPRSAKFAEFQRQMASPDCPHMTEAEYHEQLAHIMASKMHAADKALIASKRAAKRAAKRAKRAEERKDLL